MKKTFCIVLLAIFALTFLFGCAGEKNDVTQINPYPDSQDTDIKEMTLYYGDPTGKYLIGETIEKQVPSNITVEEYALQKLISGPEKSRADKKSLINPSTSVISVDKSSGIMTVTFSEEFNKWGFLGVKSDSELLRLKAAAVYSVVNTMIELTGCSRVQILVEKDGAGSGRRLFSEEMGLSVDSADILGPLEWNGDYVLTPKNLMKYMLSSILKKDYETVYTMIAYEDINGEKPGKSAFIESMDNGISLENYEIGDYTVSSSGKNACVFINYAMKNAAGERRARGVIPVALVNEDGAWKVEYSKFNEVFVKQVSV